jgi:hypothetical protein
MLKQMHVCYHMEKSLVSALAGLEKMDGLQIVSAEICSGNFSHI